jgi:hypothetical protein
MRSIALLLLVAALGCGTADKPMVTTETVVSRVPVEEGRIPDEVRASLEQQGLNVGALQSLIDRVGLVKPEGRAMLLQAIVSDKPWGLSAVKGSPESYLVDEIYAKVPGYRKVND